MKINRKTHLEIRLQNLLFSLLFLVAVGLVGWLNTQYTLQFDWTASHRHTLSEPSLKVLSLLKEPLVVTAYARENQQVREPISDLVARYQRYKKDLALDFINPDTQPDKVRELGISVDGELVIAYQGRTEKLQDPNETSVTNALQRLATAEERRIVFLQGHGERSPQGEANHDLHLYADELKRRGFTVTQQNLAVAPLIRSETDVLVITAPKSQYLPGESKLVLEYINQGRNLLWLADPGELRGLSGLADRLGMGFLPGTVVDASTQLLGIDDPTFALVSDYPPHALTQGFKEMTLFPTAAALVQLKQNDFQAVTILSTQPRSWTEIGSLQGKIGFDQEKGEKQGPLELGYALTRTFKQPLQKKTSELSSEPLAQQSIQQRIIVVGDGDFVSNGFVGTGGNLDLGVNMIQWLSRSDHLINIPAKMAPDRKLDLSPIASSLIAIGFLFVLPALLIGIGAWIWFKRRSR